MRLLALIFALVNLWTPAAQAEKRVALVIANEHYTRSVGPLTNVLNDIHLVGRTLERVGFEVLRPVENATRVEILRGAHEFASILQRAGPNAIGFLCYSGHGVALAGENYLIPIDITEASPEQSAVGG